ncbi:MAG TPA: SPOR domain-containing protein [Longimicrobiales bacterium]|nr:SPOR domain-containing protein [Longimicrobiales bacterium]
MRLFRAMIAAFVLAAGATAAQAQDLNLQRVQNLITAGRFTEARTVLTQWQAQAADRTATSVDDLALGLFLGGVLATDAKEAEDVYVSVVLSYPSSSVAPQALLRLGQTLLTQGENRRALAYLERLRSDYPGTAERETGMLWLARAQLASGTAAAACTTVNDALPGTANENVKSLLELERDRACGAGSAVPQRSAPGLGAPPAADPDPNAGTRDAAPPPRTVAQADPPRTQPADMQRVAPMQAQTAPPRTQAETPRTEPAPQQAAAARGGFAVQVGAYRERRSAEVIAAQMREKGFDARIVQLDDSSLHRIRFGFFATSAEAAVAGQRVRNAGFASIIVNDTARERQ